MATHTKEPASTPAGRWRQHTEEYLRGFKAVADDIHEEAQKMPNNSLDDAEKIVEMSVEKVRTYAEGYRAKKR